MPNGLEGARLRTLDHYLLRRLQGERLEEQGTHHHQEPSVSDGALRLQDC